MKKKKNLQNIKNITLLVGSFTIWDLLLEIIL